MLGKYIAHCEDSLTACVLPHLLHLPIEQFWQILLKACYGRDQFPESPGEPLQVDYWPKWDPTDTKNNTYVEPDVFMRFREFDLIIEAKRGDDGGQEPDQWKKEIIAYANEFGEDRVPVKMIALGGILGTTTERVPCTWNSTETGKKHELSCPVVMCRWRGLLDQCKRMRRELKHLENRDSRSFATSRILDDVIGLFGSHGYSTGRWFADFNFGRYHFSSSTAPHHSLFRSRTLEFNQK